jgi:hypothetical protein
MTATLQTGPAMDHPPHPRTVPAPTRAARPRAAQVRSVPHGDHLSVVTKPRAGWNSASFAAGTAAPAGPPAPGAAPPPGGAQWMARQLQRGRGFVRSVQVRRAPRKAASGLSLTLPARSC